MGKAWTFFLADEDLHSRCLEQDTAIRLDKNE